MSSADQLPYRAALEEYQQQAEALLGALQSADEAAAWRFKWLHPRRAGIWLRELGRSCGVH